MAARSSAGVGVGITITLLGVACLGLFISTIVFYSKFQRADRDLTTTRQDWDTWVRRDEQNGDTMGHMRELARKGNKSVLGYLNDAFRTTMQKATGNASDSLDQLATTVKGIQGAETGSLVGVIRDREASIADLTSKLAKADQERLNALANMEGEATRVKEKIASYDKTIATLSGDIDRYKSEVEQYREAVNKAKLFMDEQIARTRDQASAKANTDGERIRTLESQNLQLNERVSQLTQAKTKDILQPKREESLVDGAVIGAAAGSNEVTINLGRRQKVVLGMSFSVYSDATAIKAGPDNSYPMGKGSLEVTSVDETTSTCRIIRETRGNPIVRGDVIANPIYDPNKVYTMLVFGNFDTNGDGAATPLEAADIKAIIENWGGKVTDELSGSVDFLVLGQRPIVPPAPPSGALPAVQSEFFRLDALATRYDELARQAVATSVPILNENRLYTLIGRRPGMR